MRRSPLALVPLALAVITVATGCAPSRTVPGGGPREVPDPGSSTQLTAFARSAGPAVSAPPKGGGHRVIVFVWDGLRPDSITEADTPNLTRLRASGIEFADHHATYPTFTMVNAASFATGASPGRTGFFGNRIYDPRGSGGLDAKHDSVRFDQPVFTEDYGVLRAIDQAHNGALLEVPTLFESAKKSRGLVTATIGKSGPAFLQDRNAIGLILDEDFAWPAALVRELLAAGRQVPRRTPLAYTDPERAELSSRISADGGPPPDPTSADPKAELPDLATSDPELGTISRHSRANGNLTELFVDFILPEKRPDLTFFWLRNPDSAEHDYGPGTLAYREALRTQDGYLARIQEKLRTLGLTETTDLIVVSDHAHSSVSGPLELFPLRALRDRAQDGPQNSTSGVGNHGSFASVRHVGRIDRDTGFSVSGDVSIADLLRRQGLIAFDGGVRNSCPYSPVLSGTTATGARVYPDSAGLASCPAQKATKRTVPYYPVPATPPPEAIVIAQNGGSDFLYLPGHERRTLSRAIAILQSREEIGAIFVATRYGEIPGTLSLASVSLQGPADRTPDAVVSFAFDASAIVQKMPGIEYESMQGNRGMHGSFSPIDVHNVMIASGPSFRSEMRDPLPSGNVDLAPTVAMLLGVPFPSAEGRVLREALKTSEGRELGAYKVQTAVETPARAATGLAMKLPTDPDGKRIDPSKPRGTYTIRLEKKLLDGPDGRHLYFDAATAIRQ